MWIKKKLSTLFPSTIWYKLTHILSDLVSNSLIALWALDWFVIWSVCEVSDITPVLDFMLSRENRAGIKGWRGEVVWTERTWQLYFLLFHMLMPPVCQGRGATGSSKLTPVIHNTEHPSSVWTEAAFVTQAKKFLPNESITDRSLTSILTKAA